MLVHSSTIHKGGSNPNVHRRMDKQNGVYWYSGVSSSLKKEGNSDTRHDMDAPRGYLLLRSVK